MKRVTPEILRQMKQAKERFACLTAYDASFASLLEEAGVEVLLVGDSLGMVVQGRSSTLPVTMDDMVYHTHCVAQGTRQALLIADLPFLSYSSPQRALEQAGRLMAAGAQMVKLEGGGMLVDTVNGLSQWGIPVCGHLGLLPQSVNKLGGYRVQGREDAQARRILEDAKALEQAGADLLVLECVPAPLAQEITAALTIPVIGIGAGAGCDGQVLVLYDMLGITPGKRPRFSRDFMVGAGSIPAAVANFVTAVKTGHFPGPEHSYA